MDVGYPKEYCLIENAIGICRGSQVQNRLSSGRASVECRYGPEQSWELLHGYNGPHCQHINLALSKLA